ncbi:hypothetical protein [Secundilactobacillus malefermentans]|nr:hypothetical protein [Secundilactobacillus malefermentans]
MAVILMTSQTAISKTVFWLGKGAWRSVRKTGEAKHHLTVV